MVSFSIIQTDCPIVKKIDKIFGYSLSHDFLIIFYSVTNLEEFVSNNSFFCTLYKYLKISLLFIESKKYRKYLIRGCHLDVFCISQIL